MTDTPMPDWVLLEAAKRCEWEGLYTIDQLQRFYTTHEIYAPLCDMILKHEQPPVDRKLLCAREACAQRDGNKAYQYRTGARDDYGDVKACVRAIELWGEGFGK